MRFSPTQFLICSCSHTFRSSADMLFGQSVGWMVALMSIAPKLIAIDKELSAPGANDPSGECVSEQLLQPGAQPVQNFPTVAKESDLGSRDQPVTAKGNVGNRSQSLLVEKL